MTKHKRSPLSQFFAKLGPGLITGASDDDPSGIATYLQAGAQFGLTTLWTALITFPLMLIIQEMCARVGLVTSEGLTSNIKKHYPAPLLYFVILLIVPAILLNIGANIAAMGAVMHLLLPMIPSDILSFIFTLILMLCIIFLSYEKIVSVLKYLCLSLVAYLFIPFLIDTHWALVFKGTFIPTVQLSKEYLSILVAILGTTISPYLFFWQATMEAENKKKNHTIYINRKQLKEMNKDVVIGMLSSNLVMFFILLTAGSVLHPSGIHRIATIEQAALALEPLAGQFAYLLFAIGIIGTSFMAIPVLSGCLSYILSTSFNWKSGLDKKFYQASGFYWIIIIALMIGLGLNFIEFNPIQALLWTAILYGATAPLLILTVLHLANNKTIMGKNINRWWSNILGLTLFFIMLAALVLLIYFQFF